MTKKLTLLHAIENKYNHKFERQLRTYLESFRLKNLELFNQVDILFVQPTDNNVTDETIDFIQSYGAKFIKIKIDSGQSNQSVNFTNNVNSVNAVIEHIDTEYICWLDTDIVFLKSCPNFFQETNSIVSSILPIPLVTKITPYTHAREIDTGTDMDLLYQEYFKDYLPAHYKIDKLDSYVNTWLTYGKRQSTFWKEWQDLTLMLINIIHLHNPDQVNLGLESICEELAVSILNYTDRYTFENVSSFFGNNCTAMIDSTDPGLDLKYNCCLLHYRGIMEETMPELDGNYKNDSVMILNKMLNKKSITNQDYLRLLQDAR